MKDVKLKWLHLFFFAFLAMSCRAESSSDEKVKNLEKEIQSLKDAISKIEKKSGSGPTPASNSIISVVKKVSPSVVAIHSAKIIEVQQQQYFNPFEEFFFGQPRDGRQPKDKYKQQGLGSGVIFTKEGHILSNHHVTGEADEIQVTLADDRQFEAEIVGTDKLSDVAVIKIKNPPKDLPVAVIGNSENLEVGETVIAIGSPFGYSNTVTTGIISAKGRQVGLNSYENYLQTDASINPGNSGGALVNMNGELIGVNTAIASRTGGSHGIGFAIPINMAKSIMDELLDKGSVTRGYLGVYLQDVDKNVANALGRKKNEGALVTSVIEDSPAAKAGFKDMDLILKVNGEKVKNVNHLRNLVAMLRPDKSYKFEVIRDKKEKILEVKVGHRDEDQVSKEGEEKSGGKLGLQLEDINRNHAYKYSLNVQSGVVVIKVEMGSAGDKAGLQEGDVILSVNKEKVNNVREFKDKLKKAKGETALIMADRRGYTMVLGLALK